MLTIKERLEELKKEKEIGSDADLLREIYKDMKAHKLVKAGTTEEMFVSNKKGSFNQMIDEKRRFDPELMLPLERVLQTSMLYLLEGRGAKAVGSDDRGLRYTAKTDTKGNYEQLVKEDVYLELDEYRYSLLDYMIEYKSRNGFEFFASRNELPLNEICELTRAYTLELSQYDLEALIRTMLEICKPETMLKYLNGYYFVEKNQDPIGLGQYALDDLRQLALWLVENDEIRERLSDYKEFPLGLANRSLYRSEGKASEKTAFVNFFFNQMLALWAPDENMLGSEDGIAIELFEKAIELNKAVMPTILALGYPSYRIGDYGYVYSGSTLCGSIATIPGRIEGMEASYSPKAIEKYRELVNQIRDFQEKISGERRMSFMDGELHLAKQDSEDFYDFYKLMNDANIKSVGVWYGTATDNPDEIAIGVPKGKVVSLSQKTDSNQLEQALKMLAEIDSISETALGRGKTYVFPELAKRSLFYVDGDTITGIVPTEVKVGERYDNLAELIAQTCLVSPSYIPGRGIAASLAKAFKTYGIPKKELASILESLGASFIRSASRFDRKTEDGKFMIALAYDRAVWLDLNKEEILEQYK